jgi:hypothetical protein
MHVPSRSQVYANTTGSPYRDRGIGDLKQQARTVFNRASVDVSPVIAFVVKELIEQVAVRSMNLHAVKTCHLGVFGSLAVGLDDAGDFIQLQCAGRDK